MSEDYMTNYAAGSIAADFGIGYMIFWLAIAVVMLVAVWKMYVKADRPGWASLIPFYNTYVMYDIAMGNGWLFLLSFIPFVNIVMSVVVLYKLAKAFGKGTGFALGLIFLSPIFICILGFGSAEYEGPQ